MNDEQFWSMIESAWQAAGGYVEERAQLAAGQLAWEQAGKIWQALDDVIPTLQQQLDQLSPVELLAFDRILERKLYDLDRKEVHAATDGSDDGFLYARGFIVAAGRQYYQAVSGEPARALMDLECERICYLSHRLYEDKYGAMPPSGISRESGWNTAGWPDLAG